MLITAFSRVHIGVDFLDLCLGRLYHHSRGSNLSIDLLFLGTHLLDDLLLLAQGFFKRLNLLLLIIYISFDLGNLTTNRYPCRLGSLESTSFVRGVTRSVAWDTSVLPNFDLKLVLFLPQMVELLDQLHVLLHDLFVLLFMVVLFGLEMVSQDCLVTLKVLPLLMELAVEILTAT